MFNCLQNRSVWRCTEKSVHLCTFWGPGRGCNRILCPVRGFETISPSAPGSEQPHVLHGAPVPGWEHLTLSPKGPSGCCGDISRLTACLELSFAPLTPYHFVGECTNQECSLWLETHLKSMALFPFSRQSLSAGVCEAAPASLDERHSTEMQFRKSSFFHTFLFTGISVPPPTSAHWKESAAGIKLIKA